MLAAGLDENDSLIPSQRWQPDGNSFGSNSWEESEEGCALMETSPAPVSTSNGNLASSSVVAPKNLQKLFDGIKPRTASQSAAHVLEPHAFDVLLGRGKCSHPGNQLFRHFCVLHKAEYMKW